MKNILLLSIAFLTAFALTAQSFSFDNLEHDGLDRKYIVYIPSGYSETEALPLLFNFHGYGSNANEQMFYGDFRSIAEEENFILVHPDGELLGYTTHFNVGGWTLDSTVDDVGFTNAMIDQLISEYNIDETRIYSTGMSNGGFMSYLLACQLSDRIAAIASVTGSMTPETYADCNPTHPTPIMHIHGTDDETVPYTGEAWTLPVLEAIQYWVDFNQCDTTYNMMAVEDTNMSDGTTADHFTFTGGQNGSSVEHFRINFGGHTWPGSAISFGGTNYDISASTEIWRFLSQFDINGLRTTTNIENLAYGELVIYPNPSSSSFIVETNQTTNIRYQVYNTLGESISVGQIDNKIEIDLSKYPNGIYWLETLNGTYKLLKLE